MLGYRKFKTYRALFPSKSFSCEGHIYQQTLHMLKEKSFVYKEVIDHEFFIINIFLALIEYLF